MSGWRGGVSTRPKMHPCRFSAWGQLSHSSCHRYGTEHGHSQLSNRLTRVICGFSNTCLCVTSFLELHKNMRMYGVACFCRASMATECSCWPTNTYLKVTSGVNVRLVHVLWDVLSLLDGHRGKIIFGMNGLPVNGRRLEPRVPLPTNLLCAS